MPGIEYRQRNRVDESGLARTLPLLARYRASDHLIVGTTDDYLTYRQLTLASGEPLERWGDCLLGWQAAKDLGLKPGDNVLTQSENMLDLTGAAPLRMRVRGVLNRTGEADDEVIFCHLETCWIIAVSVMDIPVRLQRTHPTQMQARTRARTLLRTSSVTRRSPNRT